MDQVNIPACVNIWPVGRKVQFHGSGSWVFWGFDFFLDFSQRIRDWKHNNLILASWDLSKCCPRFAGRVFRHKQKCLLLTGTPFFQALTTQIASGKPFLVIMPLHIAITSMSGEPLKKELPRKSTILPNERAFLTFRSNWFGIPSQGSSEEEKESYEKSSDHEIQNLWAGTNFCLSFLSSLWPNVA